MWVRSLKCGIYTPDYISHDDLCELVIEAGFRGVKSLYYLNQAPLAIEGHVVTHEQGDNRDKTVKEGKKVTESEVIGEGLNNNINCGGLTEGDIEFEDTNLYEVGRNINEFKDTSGELKKKTNLGALKKKTNLGELKKVLQRDLVESKKEFQPSFERDYEADRSGGDENEKYEDDILEDVEWVSDMEYEELQKIHEHFRSFKKKSQPDAEIDNIVDQLGMVFENSKQFKSTLTEYAIAKRFDFRLAKNDKDKTRVVCKSEGCPFTIYASIDSRDNLYKVKTFVDKHTCLVTFKISHKLHIHFRKLTPLVGKPPYIM
ncbi:hypothetical protein V6N11_031878 [Hibiscus sabdariffa]|uniref:Transposase MuDR plant domain-containing protein n=1 Tax=Hibiscus sabdariffa TaxID=183260 RepID=A0ABR2SYY4_9ROSI